MDKKVLENQIQIDKSVIEYHKRLYGKDSVKRIMLIVGGLVFYHQFIKLAMQFFLPLDKIKILDFGCGKGENLENLARYYPNAQLTGVDINVSNIAIANKRLKKYNNITLKTCDLLHSNMHFDKDFDIIICSEVYEHVTDTNLLLQRLKSLLSKEGIIILSTPSGWMFSLPRITNFFTFKASPRRYWRLYLNPEKNWTEALDIHPAISVRKLKKQLKLNGLLPIHRVSSSFYLPEPTSIIWKLAYLFNKPTLIYDFYLFMEGLMNLVPLFRIFESRQIHLVKKQKL